jgi:transcription initiation factor TFIIIB Brf1 subunit/transcription initiation factor TFIIB
MAEIAKMQECPDCASPNVVFSEVREQLICRDCGLIFEPLVTELEAKFERTHGLKLGASKAPKKAKKPKSKPAKKAKKRKK